MATYTPNFNLKKPEQDEFYNVEDFNDNWDKIDTAVAARETPAGAQAKANAAAAAGEAAAEEVQDALATHLADYTKHVPSGLIAMWSGLITAIPTGWALCDGENGTPNLRNRFIIGAGNNYNIGDIGGEETHTLSTTEMPSHSHTGSSGSSSHSHTGSSGSSSHSHTGSTNSTGSHTHQYSDSAIAYVAGIFVDTGSKGANNSTIKTTDSGGTHSHSLSVDSNSHSHTLSIDSNSHTHTLSVNPSGSGDAHENRPPYYALAYIMKL